LIRIRSTSLPARNVVAQSQDGAPVAHSRADVTLQAISER
jgi:hypothetical protein